jgi:hypothetical protein
MQLRIITAALLLNSSLAWAETTSSLGIGFNYSTGKYGGTTSTDIWEVPVTGRIASDNLFFKVTVPYIKVTSSGTPVIKGMGPIKTTTTTGTTTQAGLGDIVASGGYIFYETYSLLLDIAANVKFGTASAEKNLGTGENDYSTQLDGYYTVNKNTLFATAGYKVVGAPAGISVSNIAYGTLGISHKTGETSSAGLLLDAAQSTSDLRQGTKELYIFISNKISPTVRVQANLLKGFSDSSPDFGGGMSITGSF